FPARHRAAARRDQPLRGPRRQARGGAQDRRCPDRRPEPLRAVTRRDGEVAAQARRDRGRPRACRGALDRGGRATRGGRRHAMSFDEAVTAAVALFVTIDPVGSVPLFIALTRTMDIAARRMTAIRACVIAFVILTFFGLFGETMLEAIGISMSAF